MERPTVRRVWYVGDDAASFQGSTPAEVVGLVVFGTASLPDRLCLHLRYPDGQEDYAPLTEAVERGFLRERSC